MAIDQVAGRETPESSTSEYNVLRFLFQQMLRQVNTFHAAKVLSCTNSGGLSPVGYVDVQLMVNQVDGSGRAVSNSVIHNVPYSRVQGGANAVICDPEVGDLGFVAFAQRDITAFKNTKAQANPGSPREFALPDAVWVCSWPSNITPNQFVRFHSGGIEIEDKNSNTIEMNATGIVVNGTVFYRDHSVWTDAEITAMSSHTVSQHRHKQGNDSRGDTEQDVNTPYG